MELLNWLIYMCLSTYEEPLTKLAKSLDYYEEIVFLRPKKVSLLKSLYHIKRRVDLFKRMLILSFEILDALHHEDEKIYTRDTRDLYVKLQHMLDALSENIHQLLIVYFRHRHNEPTKQFRY